MLIYTIEKIYDQCEIEIFVFDFYYGDFAKLREVLANLNVGLAINSVGVGRELLERFGDRPEVDTELLRVNALGAAEFLSCILSPMERFGGGQIVVLSSSQGIRPIAMLAAYSASKSLISFLCEAIDREYSMIKVQCLTPALVATKMTYYKKSSLFVISAKQFAKEAVSILGIVHRTSGCLNHEIQLLLRHLFPWIVLKYLIMPIYWLQQRRMINIQAQNSKNFYFNTNKLILQNSQNLTTFYNNQKQTTKIPAMRNRNRS